MKWHASQIIHFLLLVWGVWEKKTSHNAHFQQYSELSVSQHSHSILEKMSNLYALTKCHLLGLDHQVSGLVVAPGIWL